MFMEKYGQLSQNYPSYPFLSGALGNSRQKDFNPIALRKAKIEYNFGHSECNRVNVILNSIQSP